MSEVLSLRKGSVTKEKKWGSCLNFVCRFPVVLDTSFPQALTPPLQVVPSETPTSLVLPPLASFFQCLFCASGLFKLIQTLPQRLACLLGLLAFRSVSAMSLFTGYGRSSRRGRKKETPQNQQPLFQYANNMLCCLHQIRPILADSLIFRWDTMIPLLHWQMSFRFTLFSM